MRLISLHEDAVRALERLRVPFDDVTPEGLWGSPYHLIGVTAEQRSVLDSWNLEVNDVTPTVLSAAAGLAPQLKESWPAQKPRILGDAAPREASRDSNESPRTIQAPSAPSSPAAASRPHPDSGADAPRDAEVPVPMSEEPKRHGDPLGEAAVEREIVERAAAAAEQRSSVAPRENGTLAEVSPKANGAAAAAVNGARAERRDPTRLRVSVGGKYREASVQQGKILLDGQSFDSPA